MFRELPPTVALEEEVLKFWKERGIFRRSLERSRGRPQFTFYEGPPTANGTPHNGHVLTRVIKDLVPRYKTMRGYHVPRKAGWDTHGLPVEVEVQKRLGLPGPREIREYGLDRFSRACLDSVFSYVEEWERLTERIGFWIDLGEAYATFHRYYVESVWWALKRLFDKGLLYQGQKVVWWWPQGGTALSAGEVGLGYRTVDDPAIVVAFRLRELPRHHLLAWTTTPWTLPSNVALAVRPDAPYVFVKVGEDVLILAEQLSGFVKGERIKTVPGSELVGLHYEPLYTFAEPEGGRAYVVIGADFVTLDQGTGVVHVAPAFGEEDFKAGREHGLGILNLVAPDGTFVEGTGFLEGRFCKDCDQDIIDDLRRRGLLLKAGKVRHEYPFCWRAEQDPLIQYARPAWFIRTTALNREALANNARVNWLPEHIRDGRFGDFLRNNVDWALSRERFWGTPLPIWTCERCGHQVAIGSASELEERAPGSLDPSVDPDLQLHRPWIDRVTFRCEHCGGTMHRVPEVIDCWFDAGCMPFAQWGWPHRNHDIFKASFPADFISEAVDQTRGWFYALLMVSTLLFDEQTCREYGLDGCDYPHPYKSCVVLGHVTDAEGRKESKSKGNYVPPELVIRGRMKLRVEPDPSLERGTLGLMEAQVRSLDLGRGERIRVSLAEDGEGRPFRVVAAEVRKKETVHLHPDDLAELGEPQSLWLQAPFEPPGADAFRWLFYSASPPWTNTRLSLRAVRDAQREFLLRLRNVYQFFAIYANIAGFDPRGEAPPLSGRHLLDRWVLHELDALREKVTRYMDAFRIYEAARALQTFTESLSNWYVRRSRRRFWGEGPELQAALWTLYEVLVTLSKLLAPFVPFTAEALYRALVVEPGLEAEESVHLCDWPEERPDWRAPELARDMALLRELASLGLAARSRVKVRVRQPLAAAHVVLAEPGRAARLEPLLPLLREELNVRELRFVQDAERYVDFRVKPDYRALGPRLGKAMKAVARAIAQRPAAELRRELLAGGTRLELPGGQVVELGPDDVRVEVVPREGYQAAGSAVAVVALETTLDDDLRQEGLARELVNRVQNLRKKRGLGYTDRIRLGVDGDPALLAALERFRDYVARETLTVDFGAPSGDVIEERVDGMELRLSLERVEA